MKKTTSVEHSKREIAPAGRRASWPWPFRALRSAVTRAVRARDGATAIEAALVMAPFLVMCFGILEVAMLYFVAAALEGQVAEASRQVRTGNVQGDADPVAAFSTLLCGRLGNLIDCDNVIIDVRNFNNFGTLTYPPFVDENGDPQDNQFLPGNAGDIVLVRVTYRWEIMTPFMGKFLGDDGGDAKRLSASAVFRNEPFTLLGG